MNSSRIFIALAVLVGLGVVVTTTLRSREARDTVQAPSTTLQAPKRDEITEFSIGKPDGSTIVVKKQADGWRLTAPVDAEAGEEAVDSVLDRLSGLTITGVAATRKENHEKLEVDPKHGIHVIAKAGDKTLLDVYLGVAKSDNTLLRVEGTDPVLRAKGVFRYVFDKTPRELRNREITKFDSAQLTSLSVSSPKGTFNLERKGDAWAQAAGQKPLPKFEPTQAQTLASTASGLRAQDFAGPEDTAQSTGLAAPQGKLVLNFKDGAPLEVLIGNAKGDNYFVKTSQSDVVYLLPRFSAERLMPDAKFFETPPPPPPAAPPDPTGMPPGMGGAPPGMGGMPPGMGGGVPGTGNIDPHGRMSPEAMDKLIKAQQAEQAKHRPAQ